MNLTLNDTEIKTALEEYVARRGLSTLGRKVTINLKAGRGANGYKAEVEIGDAEDTVGVDIDADTIINGNTNVAAIGQEDKQDATAAAPANKGHDKPTLKVAEETIAADQEQEAAPAGTEEAEQEEETQPVEEEAAEPAKPADGKKSLFAQG